MKPDPTQPVRREEFGRFKYAEEFAQQCDRQGWRWVMWREADEPYVEGGETYHRPVYIVETQ